MKGHISDADWELERDFQDRILPLSERATWVLRITEYKDKPVPVFIVRERFSSRKGEEENGNHVTLKDRGSLYGQPLRRCMPVIRSIMSFVKDEAGVPLYLQRFLKEGRITYRGNLPLDEEAGAKLALIFKLQGRIKEMDRVELLARRVERFSREEAIYWFTRTTQYGEAANRWAEAGMRVILAGQPGDPAVLEMLEELRK